MRTKNGGKSPDADYIDHLQSEKTRRKGTGKVTKGKEMQIIVPSL